MLNLIRGAEHIDLAVMDLQLPLEGSERIPQMLRGDGRQLGLVLGERLRDKFPDIPILFWSGSAARR